MIPGPGRARPMTQPNESKQHLRRELIARRAALPEAEQHSLSTAILARLRSVPAWAEAREVLTYMPIRGEVNTAPLLEELWERGSRVLLPRCRPDEPGLMDVACATCLEDLSLGMYGILEPAEDRCTALIDATPDLILMPGVGFDRTGYRLGFGAGFYDRFLSGSAAPQATLIGLAYSFQVLNALPWEPWDVPVHAVITENEILWT